MVTFASAAFEDGTLPTSEGVIYTVPPDLSFMSQGIFLFNAHASEQIINVYLRKRDSDTSQQVRRIVLKQNESATVLVADEPIRMSTGDTLRADTTNTSAVKYAVLGSQEIA